MARMTTPDGIWTVDVIELNGRPGYRVKRYGRLAHGRHQLLRSLDEVRAVMGAAFEQLTEVR